MKYEKIRYPDGQICAKITEWGNPHDGAIKINERINSYEDLIFIRALCEAIDSGKGFSSNPRPIKQLTIPCLFGQRSDRRFDWLQSFDLKVIAEIINACQFDAVEILDPHSDVALALINNSRKLHSFPYVEKAVADITTERQLLSDGYTTPLVLISPDAGAYKKVFEYGKMLSVPVIAAVKHRDKKGVITLNLTTTLGKSDCLIVDDLCDGGATFVELAKALRIDGARKIYLYVTHGIFSKGFLVLKEFIDHIYCTNSVKDIKNDIVVPDGTAIPLLERVPDNYLTQFKVI